MKKNIYNDEETFFKWVEQLDTSKKPPRHYHHMLNKKLKAYFPKYSFTKPFYRRTAFKWTMGTVCTAALCLCFSTPIRANIVNYFSGVFVSNPRIDAIAETEPHFEQNSHSSSFSTIPELKSNIADESSFSKNTPYNSVSDVVLSKSDTGFFVPDFLFNSGDIAVFTQTASNGWSLKKGDTLTVTLKTDPYFSGADGNGESILFGYILDKKFYEMDTQTNTEFTFTLTAPEDGIYYPCIENFSISYIKILSGKVATN